MASWEGDHRAAVLYVHRLHPDEHDLPGDAYEDETEHLVRGDDGEWVSTGSGGGGWLNVFDPPIDLLEKYIVFGTGTSGTSNEDGELVSFTGGLCSSRVAAVETSDRTGTRRYPIVPSRPFFVVGVLGQGVVRVLSADGEVLVDPKGHRLEFEMNE